MAERIAYLQAVVGADISSFRYGMQKVRNEIGILGNSVNRVSEAARLATFTLSAPLALMGTGFLKAASDFEASMRDINSVAQLTEGQLKSLSTEVLDYAQEVRAGGNALASSLATVYRAGIIDQTKAMDLMKHAVKTAEAGLADIDATTQALVGTVQAYSTQMMTAERASNAMTRLMQVGVGTMSEFGNAIAKVNPLGSALNIELEELYSHLAFLTQKGLKADTASTQLRQALTQLVKPTTALQTAFKTLGVSGAQELIANLGGLQPALQAIIGTTDGSAVAIGKLFTNLRGMQAVLQFGNDMDGLVTVIDRFKDGVENATQEAWEQQMKSFSAQVDLLRSAWEKLAITLGNILMPILTPLVQGLTQIIKRISEMDSATLQLGVVVGGLVAILPPLVWLFTSILNPVGLIITGITALISLFTTDFMGIRTAIMTAVDDAVGGLDNLKNTVYSFVHELFPELAPERMKVQAPQIDMSSLEPKKIEFTVGQNGQSLYDFWESQLKESHPNWNTFYREMVVNAGRATGVGESFTFTLDGQVETNMDSLREQQMWLDAEYWMPQGEIDVSTFWSRLVGAINNAMPAVESIIGNVRNWFDTELVPAVLGVFVVDEESGNSPLIEFLKSVLFVDLSGFAKDAEAFISQVGNTIAQTLPLILPELARGLGLLIGRGVSLFIQFINSIAQSLVGAIGEGNLFQEAVDLIVTPFLEGLQEAFSLSNLTEPQKLIASLGIGLFVLAGIATLVGGAFLLIKGVLLTLVAPFSALIAGVGFLKIFLGGLAVIISKGLVVAFTGLTGVLLPLLIPFGLLALKIGLVVVAVSALKWVIDAIYLAFTDWDAFIVHIQDTFNGFVGALEGIGTAIYSFLEPALTWVINAFNDISNAITGTLNNLSRFMGLTGGDINLTSGGGGGNGTRGFGGGIMGFATGGDTKGFATGGNVKAGVPSMVGETGRELFIPNANGRIVPNWKTEGMMSNRGGNSTSQSVSIVVNGVRDVDGLLSELRRRGVKLT